MALACRTARLPNYF